MKPVMQPLCFFHHFSGMCIMVSRCMCMAQRRDPLVLSFSLVRDFPSGGCTRGGGNWGTLRIPREDWGTLGNTRKPPLLRPPPYEPGPGILIALELWAF